MRCLGFKVVCSLACLGFVLLFAGCEGNNFSASEPFDGIAPTVDAFDAAIPDVTDDVTDEGDSSDPEAFDLSTPDPNDAEPDAQDVDSLDVSEPPNDIDEPVGPFEIYRVDPDRGSSVKPGTVALHGSGFYEGMEVWFGANKSPFVFVLNSQLANCTVPPAPAGLVDVFAKRPDGEVDSIKDAFTYEQPLSLVSVEPSSGSATGGSPIVIKGSGFAMRPIFMLGDRQAVSVRFGDDGTAFAITPPHDPGLVNLRAITDVGQAVLEDAYLFEEKVVRPSLPGVSVASVFPDKGPAAGGTRVTIVGTGFAPGTSVRFGGIPATSVVVVSETEIQAVTPVGSPGLVDVSVRVVVGDTTLVNGFEYQAPDMQILAVEPESGAIAGGTIVRIMGYGLADVDSVFFGDIPSPKVVVESATSVYATAPRADETGAVTVTTIGDGEAAREKAFRYFDPTQRGAGTWGPPIRGDVNVTVLSSQTGRGLPDAYVILGADPHTPYQGLTDDRGQITFAGTDLTGPVAVHATSLGYSASSIVGFDARNVTLYISGLASPENPVNPPGTGTSAACTVSGRVLDYEKYFIKPFWAEGHMYGQCWTSGSTMFGGNPDPGPGAFPDRKGNFKINVRRGQFSVVCAAMVKPPIGNAYMVRMGVVPGVTCSGAPIEGINVRLNIETDRDLWLAVPELPEHPLGINGPGLWGGWNLGADGFLDLLKGYQRVEPDRIRISWQPKEFTGPIAGEGYSIYQSISTRSMNGMPYSVTMTTGLKPETNLPVAVIEGSDVLFEQTSIPRAISAMTTVPEGILMADDGGAIYLYDGNDIIVQGMRTGTPIRGIWGVSKDDFWVVGEMGRVWHFDGRVATRVASGVAVDFYGISGVVGDNGELAMSLAGGPYLLRYENSDFRFEMVPGGVQTRAVKRFFDNTIVAVGVNGAVVTGVSGTPLQVEYPVEGELIALDAVAVDDFWTLSKAGELIRKKGDDFEVWQIPWPADYKGLVRRGECDVLVYGREGALVAFDCNSFSNLSVSQENNDFMAAAQFGGRLLVAGRYYTYLPQAMGFPQIVEPVENSFWAKNGISWTLESAIQPSYQQLLLSGPTGYTFWVIMAQGQVRSVPLPDFARIFHGYTPIADGTKRLNLTCSKTPGFNFNAYSSTDTNYYKQEAFSVALVSFQ